MMNRDSRAYKLLARAYQLVARKMGWLNALAAHGINPDLFLTPPTTADWHDRLLDKVLFRVERLEGRVLLSVGASTSGSDVTFTGDSQGNQLHLRVDNQNLLEFSTDGTIYTTNVGNNQTLYFPTDPDHYTLPIGAVSAIGASIHVSLGGGSNALLLDPTVTAALDGDGTQLFDKGAGTVEKLVSLTQATDPGDVWNLDGPGQGSLDTETKFTGVTSLVGGAGDDRFVVSAAYGTGAATTRIDGGTGGTNTIDYTGFNTGVNVNLATGVAPDVLGLTHINAIQTGNGNDTLTGGTSNDTLSGGLGTDVLNGGTAANTYVLPTGGWNGIAIHEAGTANTLDFSKYAADLTFTIQAGTSTATSRFITQDPIGNPIPGVQSLTFDTALTTDLVGGSANNTYVFADGTALGNGAGTIVGGSVAADGGLTDVPIPFTAAETSTDGNYLLLPGDPLVSGQQVIYHANGSTVAGLTDGKQYYVVDNPANDGSIGLAASLADASVPMPVVLSLNITGASGGSPTLVGIPRTINTLDYSSFSATPVTVDLTAGTASLTGGISNIQQVNVGAGGGTFTGGVAPDSFKFTQPAGPESVTINPGAGGDILDFSSFTDDLNVNLALATAQNITAHFSLTLANGSAPESVVGGLGNDNLNGNAADNLLDGGAGNNTIGGGGGTDSYGVGSNGGNVTISGDLGSLQITGADANGNAINDTLNNPNDTGGIAPLLFGSSITIGNINTHGGSLEIDSAKIEVNGLLSTRDIAQSSDPNVAPSLGNSGNIKLHGKSITIDGNAELLAQVETGSAFSPGTVDIEATDNHADFVPTIEVQIARTSIDVAAGAKIEGGDVSILATSNNVNILTADPSSGFFITNGVTLVDTALSVVLGLSQWELATSFSQAKATVNVEAGTEIDAANLTESTARRRRP